MKELIVVGTIDSLVEDRAVQSSLLLLSRSKSEWMFSVGQKFMTKRERIVCEGICLYMREGEREKERGAGVSV